MAAARLLIDCLIYPLRASGWVTVLVVGLCAAAPFWASGFAWLFTFFALLPAIFLVSWTSKYLVVCIDDSARGQDAPVVNASLNHDFPTERRPLKFLLACVVAGALVKALDVVLWPSMALAGSMLVLTVLPAVLVVVIVEDSLLDAINPRIVWRTIRRLGLMYVVLTLGVMLAPVLPYMVISSGMMLPLAGVAVAYLLVVEARFIGLVLRTRQQQLRLFEPNAEPLPENDAAPPAETLRELFDRLYPPSQVGRAREVYPELRRFLALEGFSPEVEHEIHQSIILWYNPQLALLHARDYIVRLLDAGYISRALNVAEAALARHSGFTLGLPAPHQRLTRLAAQGARPAMAVQMLANLREVFPDSPEASSAAVDEARLRILQLEQAEEGRRLLDEWLQRHPEHPRRGEVDRLKALADSVV